jgi:hypothetical protein
MSKHLVGEAYLKCSEINGCLWRECEPIQVVAQRSKHPFRGGFDTVCRGQTTAFAYVRNRAGLLAEGLTGYIAVWTLQREKNYDGLLRLRIGRVCLFQVNANPLRSPLIGQSRAFVSITQVCDKNLLGVDNGQ